MGQSAQGEVRMEAAVAIIKARNVNQLGGSIDSIFLADAGAKARFAAQIQDALASAEKVG
jgi:hypothetical protein